MMPACVDTAILEEIERDELGSARHLQRAGAEATGDHIAVCELWSPRGTILNSVGIARAD